MEQHCEASVNQRGVVQWSPSVAVPDGGKVGFGLLRYLVAALVTLAGMSVAAAAVTSLGPNAQHRQVRTAEYSAPATASKAELSEAKAVLLQRLHALGVSGSVVSIRRHDIAITLPPVSKPAQVLGWATEPGNVYFRPVLCYAPPYEKTMAAVGGTNVPTTCTSKYSLDPSNLNGSAETATGVRYTVGPTPALAKVPSTALNETDYKGRVVLLPGANASGTRYLLGPAELTGRIVKKALAQTTTVGRWVVNLTLTRAGTTAWNMMAKQYFHEVIGVELDGVVQTAPLTLPSSTSFTTFNGSIQISGNFSRRQAHGLAVDLDYGSLPVALVPVKASSHG